MAQLADELSKKKLKEFPAVLSKAAKEHLQPSVIEQRFAKWTAEYGAKYIQTSSIKPLWHVIGGVFVISFIMSYPRELAHYRAERDAKLYGTGHH